MPIITLMVTGVRRKMELWIPLYISPFKMEITPVYRPPPTKTVVSMAMNLTRSTEDTLILGWDLLGTRLAQTVTIPIVSRVEVP